MAGSRQTLPSRSYQYHYCRRAMGNCIFPTCALMLSYATIHTLKFESTYLPRSHKSSSLIGEIAPVVSVFVVLFLCALLCLLFCSPVLVFAFFTSGSRQESVRGSRFPQIINTKQIHLEFYLLRPQICHFNENNDTDHRSAATITTCTSITRTEVQIHKLAEAILSSRKWKRA